MRKDPISSSPQLETRLRLALEAAELATWDLDFGNETAWLDAQWSRWMGLGNEPVRLSFAEWRSFVHPDDWPKVRSALIDLLKGKTATYQQRYRIRTPDGRILWLEDRGQICDRDPTTGRVLRAIGVSRDVTQEEEKIQRDRLLTAALRHAPVGIMIAAADGTVEWVNPALEQITGYSAGELIGTRAGLLFHSGVQPESFYRELWETISRGAVWQGRMVNKTATGELRHHDVTIAPVTDNEGRPLHYIATYRDVTEQVVLEERLERMAMTDPLTELPNRRAFLEAMQKEFQRVVRSGFTIDSSFCLIDLDHFKRINDTLGHAAGDAVLRHFAQTVQQTLRQMDVCGRLGGEEFGILLPQTDDRAAIAAMERLLRAIRQSVVVFEGHAIRYTISAGGTSFAISDRTIDDVFARADRALYRAKEYGRDHLVWIAPEDQ
ncbi:sensor domain-containing diguanylate cyclase [Tepidiphilus olei]|uniref:sensor domain-containing diguanylate cyclase n=1 Tax=Tepidiphilus olei TaxID=2502184 RepID=UPI00115D43B9|nr:sensor domain-containing diguanylate cyclase [Tepidiphilus olei]